MDRQAVYSKYGGRCAYCGREIAYKDMQVDHMIPKANGGTDDMENLMPSCRTCNHYKRAERLEYFRQMIATIPKKLGEREYIYKVGMAYGFYDAEPMDVVFYFEKVR
jgi:5-methylcytosine-specific restriction endonuclease McrA